MIKSPLRYPGGKSRAVEFLSRCVPSNLCEFREPMFGGGSLTFFIHQKRQNCRFSAGDINYDLYCFWKTVKENHVELIHEVKAIKAQYGLNDGKKLYHSILDRRETPLTDFQRAVDFFILNRITFSGVVDSGGYSDGAYRGRFTDSSIERLNQAYPVVQGIEFYHQDYGFLLQQEGKDVFVFLDPPYFSATKSKLYGKKGTLHTQFDHHRFYRCVNECSHSWLITYDNCEYIRDTYKEFFQVEWELQYGMNNYKQEKAGIGKELLVSNFDVTEFCRKDTQMFFDFAGS